MALTELSVPCEFCGVGVTDAIVFLRVHVNQERVVNDFCLIGLHIFTSD